MKYISTRDTSNEKYRVSSAVAIKTGLAPNGGLFMPEEIPHITDRDIESLASLPYEERAATILSMFLDDYDKEALLSDCTEAYSEARFPGGASPLVSVGGTWSALELWHGPTCAFKDMALQIMPRLLSRALKMTGEQKRAHILVATSGDTGKAALEGYRDVPGIDITVYYPVDGVSPMQKLQMTTQLGDNVNVCAVEGNFDDAQNGVKRIFSDKSCAEAANKAGFFFSSANSINWGRLVPQIVYYFSAYCDLVKRREIECGDKINFCVPTGNFGNIFAGRIAKEMGLPVAKFICASNANCVLTDFIKTGTYDRRREFHKTMSPSMDILISSNLERLIWLSSCADLTADCMKKLADDGHYTVPAPVLSSIQETFSGYFATEEETSETIAKTFREHDYLCDTHTAVAVACYEKYKRETNDATKTVIVSTASPYKFAYDVCRSLGTMPESHDPKTLLETLEALTSTKAPAPLKATITLPVRFTKTVAPEDMQTVLFD